MSVEHKALLVLANSGRAIAESAVRSGYQVTVLDGFCDQDTLAIADCWPVSQGFLRQDMDMFVDEIITHAPDDISGVIFGAGLEESSALLKRLSNVFQLYGNDPDVFEILGKPRRFFSLLNRLRIPYPEVSFTPPYSAVEKTWLIKRTGSCGGQGVAYFDPQHSAADYKCYYQKHLPGQVMSVLFIADGKRHRTIGYNRLGMDSANAPAPFLYTGAIGQASLNGIQRHQLNNIIEKLVFELGLRGVNSFDFILNDNDLYLIDLNPRPTATLELYEHLLTDGWIKHHIQACQGQLPNVPMVSSAVVHGHQIVYAPRTLQIPFSMNWPDWVKDRPADGTRIVEGQPLCSLFASDTSVDRVEAVLESYQEDVLQMFGTFSSESKQRKAVV
ncbi:MAG: ATP-grasp domain-containing protein [Candidatus Thiodiazotropha sp. 6PLUC2]